MGRIKIELSKKKLYTLYYVQNKPPHLIGKMFGCSFSTITNRLKEYGIPLKTPASARMKYKKQIQVQKQLWCDFIPLMMFKLIYSRIYLKNMVKFPFLNHQQIHPPI